MTSYHGGKQRIGKTLAEVMYEESIDISEEEDFEIKGYCEPFCGMLGVYRHIPELFKDHKPKLKYKAGDINESVIKMWKATQKGWIPPKKCSEKKYNDLKIKKTSNPESCYIGYQYSFGGIYFGGYAPKYGKNVDSTKASKSIRKIGKDLINVKFSTGKYTQYSKIKGYIIYCDPPYENSVNKFFNKNHKLTFNYYEFWKWCRLMAESNIVFVSNYKAPTDFEKIFSKSVGLTGHKTKTNNIKKRKRIEKLYVL